MAKKKVLSPDSTLIEDFQEQRETIDRCVTGIDIKLQEIQNHITSLENNNLNIQQLISNENDGNKRGRLYGLMKSNIELIARLYSVYREFEDVKFKYRKDLSGLVVQKHRLEMDLRKIEKGVENAGSEELALFFRDLLSKISKGGNDEMVEQIRDQTEIKDPNYKL